jgi:hypothetical protein
MVGTRKTTMQAAARAAARCCPRLQSVRLHRLGGKRQPSSNAATAQAGACSLGEKHDRAGQLIWGKKLLRLLPHAHAHNHKNQQPPLISQLLLLLPQTAAPAHQSAAMPTREPTPAAVVLL